MARQPWQIVFGYVALITPFVIILAIIIPLIIRHFPIIVFIFLVFLTLIGLFVLGIFAGNLVYHLELDLSEITTGILVFLYVIVWIAIIIIGSGYVGTNLLELPYFASIKQ